MIRILLGRLSLHEKEGLIGKQIVKYLRLAFIDKESRVFDNSVIDQVILNYFPEKLLRPKSIELIVETYDSRELISFGFESYDDAIRAYLNDRNRLINDWQLDSSLFYKEARPNVKSSEYIEPSFGQLLESNGMPHDYQLNLKNRLFEYFFLTNCGCLASMPTGGGKTRLAFEVIIDGIRTNRFHTILWVVNKKELLDQTIKSFKKLWIEKGDRGVNLYRYFGIHDFLGPLDQGINIIFGGLDLLGERLDADPAISRILRKVDILIFDECHMSTAQTYSKLVLKYKDLCPVYRYLGLTATPYRSKSETIVLRNFFNDIFYIENNSGPIEYPIKYLVEKRYLSKLDFRLIPLASEEGTEMGEMDLFVSVLAVCRELSNKGHRTVIFAKSKAHAIAMNIFLQRNAISSELIIGETPDVDREVYIDRIKEGVLNVIVNHQILSTGLDIPGLESIIVLQDLSSPGLALQILGRAMRGPENGGNEENYVYLTSRNYNTFSDIDNLSDLVNS